LVTLLLLEFAIQTLAPSNTTPMGVWPAVKVWPVWMAGYPAVSQPEAGSVYERLPEATTEEPRWKFRLQTKLRA
jgi:hypothetical protein